MKMPEIENKTVKCSPSSITVKDENGKTRGIVRNVSRAYDLPFNRQVELQSKLKGTGIDVRSKQVYIDDGEIIYLHNLREIAAYEYLPHLTDCEQKHLDELKAKAARAVALGITVIPCYCIREA